MSIVCLGVLIPADSLGQGLAEKTELLSLLLHFRIPLQVLMDTLMSSSMSIRSIDKEVLAMVSGGNLL